MCGKWQSWVYMFSNEIIPVIWVILRSQPLKRRLEQQTQFQMALGSVAVNEEVVATRLSPSISWLL